MFHLATSQLRARVSRAHPAPRLSSAAFALITVAWLMTTPPGSSFDEQAHYVKAIGVGHGQLAGEPPQLIAEDLQALGRQLKAPQSKSLANLEEAVESASSRWQKRTQRVFRVPSGLMSVGLGCTYGRREVTGTCVAAARPFPKSRDVGTYTGTYQPYLYMPAGLAIRAADGPQTGVRLGRVATLAVGLALLVAAVWLLWTPAAPALSLLGLVVAVTPMVLYAASVLSPTGPEVAAAVCFCAALIRMTREEPRGRWFWVALGASGAVLVSARSLGPAFAGLSVVAIALLSGPRGFALRLRAGGVYAVGAGVAIALALVASAAWQLAYQPRPSPTTTSAKDALEPSVRRLGEIGKEAIGVFGALDAPMPGAGYLLWGLLVLALTVVSLLVATRRQRLAVVGLLAAVVIVTLVMSVVYREIGPLHGRYALPALVLLPLWQGEVILRRRAQLSRQALRLIPAAVFSVAAAVHLLGLWASARRFGVGESGSWFFFADAEWSPPLGWWPWLLAAALAAVALAGAATAVNGTNARSR